MAKGIEGAIAFDWVWSKPVGDTQKIFPHPFVLASPPQLQPTTFDHTPFDSALELQD